MLLSLCSLKSPGVLFFLNWGPALYFPVLSDSGEGDTGFASGLLIYCWSLHNNRDGVLIDQRRLSDTQRAELYEEGVLWIIDESTHQEIKLEVKVGAQLYTFLHFHDKMSDIYEREETPPGNQPFFSSYLFPGRPRKTKEE